MAWLPLESNPDVMNKYLGRMGVPNKWKIVDVFGLDEDMLAVIPRPVLAFILLFPCNEAYEKMRVDQEATIKEKGQSISDSVYYLKQYVSNACGAIALIHSVANSDAFSSLGDGCLKKFLEESSKMNPEERGRLLEKNEGFATVHNDVAVEGQTAAPPENESVEHHFVAFVVKDGCLYELDGRKAFPINHGPSSEESFVTDAGRVLRDIIAKDPSEVRFGVCALAANDD